MFLLYKIDKRGFSFRDRKNDYGWNSSKVYGGDTWDGGSRDTGVLSSVCDDEDGSHCGFFRL